MLLQSEALLAALNDPVSDKKLVVTPILDSKKQIGPGSIDLRLGPAFIEVKRHEAHVIDPFDNDLRPARLIEDRYEVPIGESLFLHPGQFLLGATFEFVKMPASLAGQVLGRSSWGRLGLVVATAVTVQPGFAGCLTLELQNLGSVPVRLFPGLRIAQLTVWQTVDATKHPYSAAAKYDAPLGPESSRIGWEADEVMRLGRIGKRLQGGQTESE
jgi:dCTP deaminase